MEKETQNYWFVFWAGLFLGIALGLIIFTIVGIFGVERLIGALFDNIQIENININLNETKLVEAFNQSYG